MVPSALTEFRRQLRILISFRLVAVLIVEQWLVSSELLLIKLALFDHGVVPLHGPMIR